MSDKKSGGDGSLYDAGIGWGILLIIFFILLYVFWYFHATDVRNIIRWTRYYEMWVMSWFISDDHTILFNGRQVNWQRGFEDMRRWPAQALTGQHTAYFSALAMEPLKIIFSIFFVLGGLWCLLFGPGTNNRRVMNLEGLIHAQSRNFPIIAPFVKFNPAKQPPRPPGSPVPAELPLFAEALGPEEWLAYHSIPVPNGKIDEAAAKEAFIQQLGGRWKGASALKPYQQVLLAAFCLKAARKRADADAIMGRLARCFRNETLKLGHDRTLLRDARRILKDSALSGKTLAQANRHAYVTTALLRALHFARSEGGVMAPAQFVWLRAYDRALWYPLNNLGRQSYHMEALGAMAHFKAERLTQRPIPMPKVEGAIETIREYMESRKARPIPVLDYSRSKKKSIKMAK